MSQKELAQGLAACSEMDSFICGVTTPSPQREQEVSHVEELSKDHLENLDTEGSKCPCLQWFLSLASPDSRDLDVPEHRL